MPAPATMSNRTANLVEIFSSIQGEGLLIGVRQIFLRFKSCNLECVYCDTQNQAGSDYCNVEISPGRREFVRTINPLDISYLMNILNKWQEDFPGVHHSISITGGEPLLEHDILLEWLPILRNTFPIYLETNGTLHLALSSLIGYLDFISMDIKLPSTSGQADMWDSHWEFLKIAVKKDVFVKIVVDDTTENWELIKSCELISSVDRRIPLVLQPLTLDSGGVGIAPHRLLELQQIAARHLKQIRIIPQAHKFLGLL